MDLIHSLCVDKIASWPRGILCVDNHPRGILSLCVGGVFAFSVEAARADECASDGWVERPDTCRHAHSAEYLRSLATAELELSSLASVELRHDGDELVSGFAVLMTKVAVG